MNNCFLSVVTVIQSSDNLKILENYLSEVHQTLRQSFADFEIILVNNVKFADPAPVIQRLPPEIKKDIFLLELSGPTNKNHAILAGLDRSNGDYIVIFEPELADHAEWLVRLYEKTQEKIDIVYLRVSRKHTSRTYLLFYKVFYWILRRYSNLKIDEQAIDSRILSRRALNSLLKHRENLRYMKALYSMVGYNTAHLDLPEGAQITDRESFSEKFRNSLVAITSYTSFLRTMLLWIFLFSLFFWSPWSSMRSKSNWLGRTFSAIPARPFPAGHSSCC